MAAAVIDASSLVPAAHPGEARGDLHVDAHHTVEDVGICLGQALAQALGDKTGIRRYGSATLPMDEVLVTSAVDLSGRAYCVWQASVTPGFRLLWMASLTTHFAALPMLRGGPPLTIFVNCLDARSKQSSITTAPPSG